MPIRHCIVHLIDKKPDGSPAVLHARDTELGASDAIENLLADLNDSYNAKQGKAWGFFHGESGAYPLSGWLKQYLEGEKDFTAFSRVAVEHLQKLMEESNLSTGGHILFAHYQQGMTEYLAIALQQHGPGRRGHAALFCAMADHGQFGFGRPKIKAMLASGLAVNKRCGLAGRPGLPEHGVNQLTHEGAAPSPRLRKRVNLCELGCLDLEAQRLFHVG